MNRTQLGEFEELVLLLVGSHENDAYSISLKKAYKEATGKNPSIGAFHSALNRLETKGFIRSYEGGATNERGGRRKRFYEITSHGVKALQEVHDLRTGLFKLIPGVKLSQ